VKNSLTETLEIFTLKVTEHLGYRMVKRSIQKEAVSIALLHGEQFYKQGLVFHVLGENNVPKNLHPQVHKKCKNLIVVTDENPGVIITSYRNNDPMRYIKKKCKRKDKCKNVSERRSFSSVLSTAC
jgi:hypothetical protein